MFPKYAQKVRNGIVFCLLSLIPIFSLFRYGNFTYLTYSLILSLPFFLIYFLLTDESKPRLKAKLKSLIFNPLFIFFVFISLSGISAFYSISRFDSLISFLGLITLGLIFIASYSFFAEEQRVKIYLPVFLIISFFLSLSGLLFYLFTHSTSSGQANLDNFSLLGGNFFTGFLLFSVPIAFWGLYKNDKVAKDLFYGLPLTVFWALLSVQAEKETIAILGVILFFLSLLFFRSKEDLRKMLAKTILVAVVAYLFSYGIGFIKDKKIIIERLQLLSETTTKSSLDFSNKKNHWESGLKIVKKFPLGTGLGTFSFVYPQFKNQVSASDKNSHSFFIQALSEIGIFGFLAVIWFFLILIWRSFKLINRKDQRYNFWAPVLFVSMSGIFLYNVVSSDFFFFPNFAVFLIFSGMILSIYNNSLPKKEKVLIYTEANRMIFLLVALLLLIAGVWQLFSNVNFNLGKDVEDYNFKDAKMRYEESIKFNPNPSYLAKLAEIDYYLRGHEDNLKQARELAERSINLNAFNALPYIVLAKLDIESGNTKEAIPEYKKAIGLNPLGEINGYIYLTDTYFKEGNYAEVEGNLNFILPKYSKEVISKIVALNPLDGETYNLSFKIVGLYNLLGVSELYLNKPIIAEDSFRKAIELDPTNPNSRYYLGVALVKQGKLEEGEKEKAAVFEAFSDYKPPYGIK